VDDVQRILSVLHLAERLKSELRHSWLSSGRRESVAEHTWQMTLMAVLMHRHLEHPVDLERTLAMIVVHDLVEAIAGDVPFFETGERKAAKRQRELEAIEEIRAALPETTGELVAGLWHEFEARQTPEAKFAVAIDNLEVQIQHNLADLATWLPLEHELVYTKMDGPCAHDRFLAVFCEAVKADAEAKLRAGGIEPEAARTRATVAATVAAADRPRGEASSD
jgi:putative hydrolases of HD superfamily